LFTGEQRGAIAIIQRFRVFHVNREKEAGEKWMNKGKAKGRDMSPDGASDEEERRESWNPIEFDPWLYCRYSPRTSQPPHCIGA